MSPARRPAMVIFSLEPRGPVRRRLQVLADGFAGSPAIGQVVYAGPPLDVLHELRAGRLGFLSALLRRRVSSAGGTRCVDVTVVKWLPRALDPGFDRRRVRRVLRAAERLGVRDPVCWVNDALCAPVLRERHAGIVYDVTDDWLAIGGGGRSRRRLAAADAGLRAASDAVVVCSPGLERAYGRDRSVEVIPNGVDVAAFRHPGPRPDDLPDGPIVLYVGTLQGDRLDVPLVEATARAVAPVPVVLVGPDSLDAASRQRLESAGNVRLLGPRDHSSIPAYYAAAAVVAIPHLVNEFTESLDPIKAYECMAAGRPTVATPVAGFRELAPRVVVAAGGEFCEAVATLVADARTSGPAPSVPADARDWGSCVRECVALVGALAVREGSDPPAP